MIVVANSKLIKKDLPLPSNGNLPGPTSMFLRYTSTRFLHLTIIIGCLLLTIRSGTTSFVIPKNCYSSAKKVVHVLTGQQEQSSTLWPYCHADIQRSSSSSSSSSSIPRHHPSSSTQLALSRSNKNSWNSEGSADIGGMKGGLVLFPLVLLVVIWGFTVPPEFRRARLCSAEQVARFPESKCITAQDWTTKVLDYYRNGGGIQWDFSVEPAEEQSVLFYNGD